MITRHLASQLSTETSQPDADDASHARWPRVRWYADALRPDRRAELRPARQAEAPIDFLGLFLHRALAGAQRLDSHA